MAAHLHSFRQRELKSAITTRSDEYAVDDIYDSHDHVAARDGVFLYNRRLYPHPLGGRTRSYVDPRDTGAPADKLTPNQASMEDVRQ